MSNINKVRIKGKEYQIGGKNYIAGENIKIEGDVISAIGGNPMIEITYDELVALRDSSQLVAGQQYCITDYETTTSQYETRSAGHNFDLIVVADSENELNENARARIKKNDNYFKSIVSETVIKSANFIDGKTPADVEILYTQYVDYSGESYEGLTEGNPKGDVIYEFSYAENNEGKEVPVMYKSDPSIYEEEGVDYEDTYFYVGTEEIDGVVYDKWRKIETENLKWDSTGKIFILTDKLVESEIEEIEYEVENANLSAWEIKYSLDNDESRFEWASDKNGVYTDDDLTFEYIGTMELNGITYYKWYNKDFYVSEENDAVLLSETLNLNIDDMLDCYNFNTGEIEVGYSSVLSIIKKGKGVIYYMKDEYGNECPYDFKNIQFNRYLEDYDENFWMYTFSWIDENKEITDTTCRVDLLNDEGVQNNPTNNKIKFADGYMIKTLPINIFYGCYDFEGGFYYGHHTNEIINSDRNIFRDFCDNNKLVSSHNNVLFDSKNINLKTSSGNIVNRCVFITFKGYCFDNFCEYSHNIVFNQDCSNNSFHWCENIVVKADMSDLDISNVSDKEYPEITMNLENINKINSSYTMKNIPAEYFKHNQELYYGYYYNIENIGEYAFEYCANLKTLHLGKNLKTIGSSAFIDCENFKLHIEDLSSWCNVYFENPNSSPVAFSKFIYDDNENVINDLIIPENVTSISQYAFSGGIFKHIFIPSGVTSAVGSSFDYSVVDNVTMPPTSLSSSYGLMSQSGSPFYKSKIKSTLTLLGNEDVSGNVLSSSTLKRVIVREPIKVIQSSCFSNCTSLEEIHLPKCLSKIEKSAFSNCSSLQRVYFEGSEEEWNKVIIVETNNEYLLNANIYYNYIVGTVGVTTYKNTTSEEVEYTVDVKGAKDPILFIPNKYDENNYISAIQTPTSTRDSVNNIITKVIFPKDHRINEIGSYAFANCKNLKEIEIPDSVNFIGSRAFSSCSSLQKVKLPDTITTLENGTFAGCKSLTNIEIPDSVTILNGSVFSNSGLVELNLNNITGFPGSGTPLSGLKQLKKLIAPKLTGWVLSHNFNSLYSLEYLEFGAMTELMFYQNRKNINFKTMIIRTPNVVCSLSISEKYPFGVEFFPNLYVYVPDDLVEQYKVATNWVNIAERIKPLSEYVEEE